MFSSYLHTKIIFYLQLLSMKLCILGVVLILFCSLSAKSQQFTGNTLQVTFEGRYTDGRNGACEIAAIEPVNSLVVVTNAVSDSIDIIDWSTLSTPVKVASAPILNYGGGANSVVVLDTNYFAVAVEATVKQDSGYVVFFDFNGNYVNKVQVGALPDMIKLTPNKQQLLVACEGEPNDAYTVDPEGTIAIIDLTSATIPTLTQSAVTLLQVQAPATPIVGGAFKPNTPLAQDLEPEYIAVNPTSTEARVICQENNVIVAIDLTTQTITSIQGLGYKDHNMGNNGFDASNRDNAINIQAHPVKGVYQPDAIVGFESQFNNTVYYATANEGDARDYGGYSSEVRIKDLNLDPTAFPNATALQQDSELGRLKTFTADVLGDTDGDGDVDELYSYGGRSISLWNANGSLVWDSGNSIETYIATHFPSFFNCNDGLANKKDSRSDDKGPEPEALAVLQLSVGSEYLAVGLERQGGVMFYDVTNPNAISLDLFVHSFDTVSGTMLDIAPEGIVFADHANGQKIMLVSNEVSGTVAAYSVRSIIVGNTQNLPTEQFFQLAPNPVKDQLHMTFTTVPNDVLHYEVYNNLGQVVQVGTCDEATTILSTIDWQAGVYWVRLQDASGKVYPAQQVVKH